MSNICVVHIQQNHESCDIANQARCSTCIMPLYLILFCKNSFISFPGSDSPCFISFSLLSFHSDFWVFTCHIFFNLLWLFRNIHNELQCCGLSFSPSVVDFFGMWGEFLRGAVFCLGFCFLFCLCCCPWLCRTVPLGTWWGRCAGVQKIFLLREGSGKRLNNGRQLEMRCSGLLLCSGRM